MSSAHAAAPFPVVAIETATETVGVAVQTPAGVQAEFALTGRRRHVETLTPALEHVLAQVGLVPADLGAVAVDIGPGLFTGLRVGVATAKALAQSLGIGVLAASSLDILTEGAARAGHRGLVLACVDARRAEVFAAVRELDADGAVVAEPIAPGLFAPADLVVALESSAVRRCWRSATAPCATAASSRRCRRWTRGLPPCRSRRRRRFSAWPWRASRRENRQSSRVGSFPSTCVRRTQRATLHARSGPERVRP